MVSCEGRSKWMPAGRFKSLLLGRESALLVLLIVLGTYLSVTNPIFADLRNLIDQWHYLVEVAMIAVPMTLIIASGGIDLSVASIMAMSGMIAAVSWQQLHLNIWLAMSLAVFIGTLAGGV